VFCNIGNPHELGQAPLTFNRQVLSLVTYPALLDEPAIVAHFPPDAVARARAYLRLLGGGGMGAYTHSQGVEGIREEVAAFIGARDGVPAHGDDIYLTDGASPAVRMVMNAMLRGPEDAVLVPIPQYPLYSASCALYGGTMANYYLKEENGWALHLGELERSLAEARSKGLHVRGIVVINPGNPTGNTLSTASMHEVLQFAARHKLVLLADEVYQDNVYAADKVWTSFRKEALALRLLDPKDSRAVLPGGVQLVSFHSTSKGFTGECGRRGGYLELLGIPEDVRAQLYKLASISLCANTAGQVGMGLMVNPPPPGSPSSPRYVKERQDILDSLSRRALKLVAAFNSLPGMSCQPAEGALYTFPTIHLSPKAVAAAKAAGKVPDAFYCMALLDATGIVVVPGSGFGQVDGTWHFRSTVLPQEREIDAVIERMGAFHRAFTAQYA
jgi:alanine transaminase